MLNNSPVRKACANCGVQEANKSRVQVYIRLPSTTDQEQQQTIFQELSIYEAIAFVFNFSSLQQQQKDDLYVCQDCLDILQDLYKNYREFSLRRRHNTYMCGKIKELNNCNILRDNNNDKENDNDSSVDIKEENEETQSTDDGTDCSTIEYNQEVAIKEEPTSSAEEENDDDDGESTSSKIPPPSNQSVGSTAPPLIVKSVNQPTLQTALPSPSFNVPGRAFPKFFLIPPGQALLLVPTTTTDHPIAKEVANGKASSAKNFTTPPLPTTTPVTLSVAATTTTSKLSSIAPTTTTSKISSIAAITTTSKITSIAATPTPTTTTTIKETPKKSSTTPTPTLPRCNYCHPPLEFSTVEALIDHVSAVPEVHAKPEHCYCAYCEMFIFLDITKEYFSSIPKFLKLASEVKKKGDSQSSPIYSLLTHFTVQGIKIPTLLIKEGPFSCPYPECEDTNFDTSINFVKHLNKIHLTMLNPNVPPPPSMKGPKKGKKTKQLNDTINGVTDKPKRVRRKQERRKVRVLKPADCELCSKKFVDISFLRLHQHKHRQQKASSSSDNMTATTSLPKITTIEGTDTASPIPSPTPTTEEATVGEIDNESSCEKSEKKSSQQPKKYECKLCHPKKKFDSQSTLHDHYSGLEPHDQVEGPCDCSECELDKFMEVMKDFVELCSTKLGMASPGVTKTVNKGTTKKYKPVQDISVQKARPRRLCWKDASRAFKFVKDPPYNCPFDCKSYVKAYQTPDTFFNHIRKVHLLKTTVCPKCSKGFSTVKIAKIHMSLCDGCNKRPRTKTFLPPFICNVCSKEFSKLSRLRTHEYTHRERNYICETCGGTFKTISCLRSHIGLVHTTERPFICEQCGKTYKDKHHLTVHRSHTHTEEGRLKYNEYMRLKNRRKRLEKLQREGKAAPENEMEEAEEDEDVESIVAEVEFDENDEDEDEDMESNVAEAEYEEYEDSEMEVDEDSSTSSSN